MHHNKMSYGGKELNWDRPNTPNYPEGTIRVFKKNTDGSIFASRFATDDEVLFIMMYELVARGAGANNALRQDIAALSRDVATVERRVRSIPGSG